MGRNLLLLFIVFFMASSCTRKNSEKKTEDTSDLRALGYQADGYCDLSGPKVMALGYAIRECDGAGFTALYDLACPHVGVDLEKFQDDTGRMHRSPNHTTCWDYSKTASENAATAGSKAGFSRDHVLMRLIQAWEQKDLAWVSSFIKFTEANSGVICDAVDDETKIGRCLMSPTLMTLLYDAEAKLKDMPAKVVDQQLAAKLSDSSADGLGIVTGSDAHLQVLRLLLKGRMYGALTNLEVATLKAQAERQPKNALFKAVYHKFTDGDQTVAMGLLKNQNMWPVETLPTTKNFCSDYLWSDDYSEADWLPCDTQDNEWDALDFTLAVWVLTAEVK